MELIEIGSIQNILVAGSVARHYFCARYTPPDLVSFAEWFKGPELLGKTKVSSEGVFVEPNKDDQAKISGPSVEILHSELKNLGYPVNPMLSS